MRWQNRTSSRRSMILGRPLCYIGLTGSFIGSMFRQRTVESYKSRDGYPGGLIHGGWVDDTHFGFSGKPCPEETCLFLYFNHPRPGEEFWKVWKLAASLKEHLNLADKPFRQSWSKITYLIWCPFQTRVCKLPRIFSGFGSSLQTYPCHFNVVVFGVIFLLLGPHCPQAPLSTMAFNFLISCNYCWWHHKMTSDTMTFIIIKRKRIAEANWIK